MNKIFKKRKKSYICDCIAVMILSFVLAVIINILGIHLSDGTDLNGYYGMIITVASIFAGFSFTNLGTLLGICGTELASKFSGTDIIEHCRKTLMSSIIYSCVSLVFAIGYVSKVFHVFKKVIEMLKPIPDALLNAILDFVFCASVIFVFEGIIQFIKSTKNISRYVSYVYDSKRKTTDEQIQRIRIKIQEADKRGEVDREEVYSRD